MSFLDGFMPLQPDDDDDDGSFAAALAVGEFDKLICFYCRDMFSFFHELWP